MLCISRATNIDAMRSMISTERRMKDRVQLCPPIDATRSVRCNEGTVTSRASPDQLNLEVADDARTSIPLSTVSSFVVASSGCPAGTMADSETSHAEISERPSAIVRIAYHQLSVMCGTRDPTAPSVVNADGADTRGMVCTRRLLGLPVFATVTSAFCGAYAAARGSHESVATILGHVENGMRAGLEFASPVTGRITDLLETPLRTVDNAVCVGLNFVEERVPSVKLPPGQIYANIKDSVRNIFTSALETLRLLFGEPNDRIKDFSNETAQGIRKVSS